MSIVKVNKSSLETSASDLKSKVTSLEGEIDSVSNTLNSIPSHSDFPSLTTKANMLGNSLKSLQKDFTCLSTNISTYLSNLLEIDSEGFDTSAEALSKLNNNNTSLNIAEEQPVASNLVYKSNPSTSNYTYSYTAGPNGTKINSGLPYNNETGGTPLVYSSGQNGSITSTIAGTVSLETINTVAKFIETAEGKEITLPSGLGSVHTYMGWQLITARDSAQYKLKESAGMNFDEEGFGRIGDRYVVATTSTFGKVGDFIDVYKEDGTIIKCIIGDIKSQGDDNCNEWGHLNGTNVIEFVVDENSWYSGHENPGTESCHPEWNKNIIKIVNKGNYFDLINNTEPITL